MAAADRDLSGGTVGGLAIRPLRGEAVRAHLPGLARLRIAVFRDFPYLYEGSQAYERDYLAVYADTAEAVVVGAFDGGALVGAATALPFAREPDEMTAPLRAAGFDPARVFYFGESVLLPDYRGRGAGVAFFRGREAHARSLGRYDHACFCAVVRPPDHPRRPPDHVPLDGFWARRGFRRLEGAVGRMAWRDLDEAAESEKDMQFWIKDLRA